MYSIMKAKHVFYNYVQAIEEIRPIGIVQSAKLYQKIVVWFYSKCNIYT